MLTWRYYRHERAFRDRSLDLKEATTITRNTVVQNGTQGMFQYTPSFLTFLTAHILCVIPSFRSSLLVRVTEVSHPVPCLSGFQATNGPGKRGSEIADRTGAACRTVLHVTRDKRTFICITISRCVGMPDRTPCILRPSPMLT